MRTFDDLTGPEQAKARSKALDELLTLVAEGAIRFNDKLNGDGLQARIDAAWKQACDMQTPWFVGEYIMETCADDLRSMAEADAQDASYPSPDERIIRI